MSVLVMKFGGTSVGAPEALNQCAEIIRNTHKEHPQLVVVISALSGVTDILLRCARQAADGDEGGLKRSLAELRARHLDMLHTTCTAEKHCKQAEKDITQLLDQASSLCSAIQILGEASPRALDAIASLGERMSILILAEILRQKNVAAEPIAATQLIRTDATHQSANPDYATTGTLCREKLLPLLEKGTVPVITGFIGATEKGVVTTLGRGGSDYSAAILGTALKAEAVWIWTDVDGVMTADPRVVPEAHTIQTLSFREISELAYYGAKVLHPKTIRPVIEAGIDLRVLNTFDPGNPGTQIVLDQFALAENTIKAVTIIKGLRLITLEGRGMLGVPGVAARTFRSIASTQTSVPLISQASSEQSICFAVPSESTIQVMEAIQTEFEREITHRDIDSVWATDEVVIISVVGAGMRNIPGVAGKVFSTLGEEKVNVIAIAQGSSEVSISFIVSAQDGTKAVRALHRLIH